MKDLNKILLSKILFSSQKKKLKSSYVLITLVVILLVLSQVFVDSMSEGIVKRYALLGSGHIQSSVNDDVSKYDFIEEANDVSTGSALAYGQGDITQIIKLKGVNKEYFSNQRTSVISMETTSTESTLSNIYISKTLSNELNIGLGEKMALVANNGNKHLYPKLCFVKGIYDSGYKELDQFMIFCDKDLINKIYDDNIIQYKEIILKDGVDVKNAASTLKRDGIDSIAWFESEKDLYTNLLTSTQTLMIVFLSIALLSGFFISAVASDVVGSSHKSISINKLMGLSSKKIRWIYFCAIEIVTMFSIISGIILGIALSYLLPFFLQYLSLLNISSLSWYLLSFDITIPVFKIFLITIFLLIVSFLSVYSALKRANSIEPIDLLNRD